MLLASIAILITLFIIAKVYRDYCHTHELYVSGHEIKRSSPGKSYILFQQRMKDELVAWYIGWFQLIVMLFLAVLYFLMRPFTLASQILTGLNTGIIFYALSFYSLLNGVYREPLFLITSGKIWWKTFESVHGLKQIFVPVNTHQINRIEIYKTIPPQINTYYPQDKKIFRYQRRLHLLIYLYKQKEPIEILYADISVKQLNKMIRRNLPGINLIQKY